jgi:phosphohistidine phosphatase
MKTLILFRHAKSRWDMGVNDRERDLEMVGLERTKKSASHLASILNFKIDTWQSSPALRARRTADIASTYFQNVPELEINENLYTFSFFDLLKVVKNLDNQHQSAIIFGHNEAFTEFVNRMGNQFIDNLPTSGVAILQFQTNDWNQIEKGITLHILKPKLL